jgi:GAF domain-containing protein
MREFFAPLTTIRAAYTDPSEQQQAQRLLLINLVWIAAIILATPFMLWWLARVPQINRGLLIIPGTVLVAFIAFELIQHGHLRQARRLFVLNLFIAALVSIFPDYRLDTPFIIVFTLPLTAAGVLLRGSRLLGIALVLLVITGVGGLAQIAVDMQPTRLGGTTESVGTSIALVFVMIGLNTVMLWTFTSSTEDVLDRQRSLVDLIAHISQIGQTLADLPAVGEDLNRVVEQLREALGLYHVQIFLADPVSGLPILQAGTGFIGRRLLEEEGLLTPDEHSPINEVLRHADSILIRDTDPGQKRGGFLPATQSELLLPLRVGSQAPLGVLDLHSTQRDAFLSEERDALVAVSNHLAAALHGARQTERLRAILEQRDQLGGQIEAAQREVARLNRQLVGTAWGTYLKERQRTVPGLTWREGAIDSAETGSEALVYTIEDGQPRLEQREDGSVLCVPIRLRGQTLGAVEFRRSDSTQWTTAALELAEVVAERLALSLENARLFEQAQTTAQREQLISHITSQLQTTTDLQSLLMLAAAQFQDALGATHTRVRLGTPAENDQTQEQT